VVIRPSADPIYAVGRTCPGSSGAAAYVSLKRCCHSKLLKVRATAELGTSCAPCTRARVKPSPPRLRTLNEASAKALH
jgi:hypothetical protein